MLADYHRNYLPTKFSGPLVTKLGKRYWDKLYIADRPIIFAIADFHCPDSMGRSQNSLADYLYGQRCERVYDGLGRLRISSQPVSEHIWRGKIVPSGFFALPDAENISAVISNGEETIMKFNRMGLRAGFGSKRVQMRASGKRCIGHPAEVAPERFDLNVVSPDHQELWIDGLHVYHNPSALRPLDVRLFGDATHHRWLNGTLNSIYVERAPFGMDTRVDVVDP